MNAIALKKAVEVLLIEDSLSDARLFERALLGKSSRISFNLTVARTLAEGLEQIEKKTPDMIFIDLNLPDSMGYETFSTVYGRAPYTPVVVLSSTGTEDIAMKTVEAGGQDYIFKENIEPEFLIRTIRYAIGRMKLINELHEAREAAEKLSKCKSEFLATMSHEIRTPMNGIIGMTSVLMESNVNPEQRECLETVRNSGEVLLKIINDILDLSKADAGKITVESVDFRLRPAIEETVELFGELAHKKNIVLTNIVDPSVPSVFKGDPERFRQVLSNLVANAIKFTSEGQVVIRTKINSSSATQEKNTLRFEIHDTGMGIPKEKEELLFQPFSQGDSSTTRKFGGTGLGLVISKRIVEAMEGKIGVISTPGKGSCFWFELPLIERAKSFFSRSDLSGKKGLVLSKSSHLRQLLCEQLSLRGIPAEPLNKTSLAELTTADIGKNDFIIIDSLNQKEEEEIFFKQAEGFSQTSNIPILVLTSQSGNYSKSDYLSVDTLRKPIRQSDLYRAVSRLLSREPKAESTCKTPTAAAPVKRHADSILIVEDNEMNQRVIGKMLTQLGFRSKIVSSGEEALKEIKNQSFSLILMDCEMPGMDGFDTTRKIRAIEGTAPRIPIIAVTAYAQRRDKEKCEASGMDGYLTKPLTLETLKKVLHEWIEPNSSVQGANLSSDTLNTLRNLKQEGEPDFLNELIDTYSRLAPSILSDLEKAVASRDSGRIKHLAHRLKGMSGNIGALSMQSLCERMQDSPLQDPVTLLRSIQRQFEETKNELETSWRIAE
jgi:two-component system, sensor histidine kinase and response regulator